MKNMLLATRIALSLLVFTNIATGTSKDSAVYLSLPGFQEKVGVAFNAKKVEMVAVYRGNNLYLRPLSKKLRMLLGKEKAVATKTLSLPEMIAEEAARGEEAPSSLLISRRSFGKPTDTFSLNLKGKNVSGRFTEERGNNAQIGIVLFLGEGAHIYRFSVDAEGLTARLHTLTGQHYKAAKKSVKEKLKAAGQKKAAKKVGKL